MPLRNKYGPPACHPNRRYYGKGLCKLCYDAARRKSVKKNPTLTAPARRDIGPDPSTYIPPKMVTITLSMRHSINGKFYGPGTLTTTEAKARAFLNAEHAAQEKEMSLQRQEAYIIGVGPGGPVKRQVPWAQFDTILNREG